MTAAVFSHLLLIAALVCAILLFFGVTFSRMSHPLLRSPNWLALALACWFASLLVLR